MLSLKVSERRRNPQKVHAIDTGLRNAACLTGAPDRGRLAETAVFGALRRESSDRLYYWRSTGEVDLARRSGNRTEVLVQVAYDPDDSDDVLEREVAALAEAGRAYRKARRLLVVARPLGRRRRAIAEGIDVVPLWRFLLGGAWS